MVETIIEGVNMVFLPALAFDEMTQKSVVTVKGLIFASPFFPEQLTFSDVLGIVSVILAILSILLALVIYKLSNDTSEKLAEEAARRAFEKKYNVKERASTEKTVETSITVNLNKEQRKAIKKLMSRLIKRAKKNSIVNPWIHAASFPIQLKNEFTEEETVRLMYEWKDKAFISWTGTLENSTKVFILRGDLIVEDIDTR